MSLKKLLSIGMAAVISFGVQTKVNAYFLDENTIGEYFYNIRIIMLWNTRQMGLMVKGQIPFDTETLTHWAKNVAVGSHQIMETLIPLGAEKQFAQWNKRENFENFEEFKARLTKVEEESLKLAEVSKTAMMVKEIEPQFRNLVKACKSCHKGTIKPTKTKLEKLIHANSADAIEYRQAVMETIKWNVKLMSVMVKGKIPFDAETFAKTAEFVVFTSKMPLEGFIEEDNDQGDTNAKPAIWENWTDFKAKMAQLQEETAKLANVSKTATTMKKVTPQFLNTTQVCKSCHKKYRK